ncbi:MAG TPA: dockerin type I domain-containing protein [Phycisphaerae bacterium]|nr:dockerin type I domain-containing protein [Phycisphaerae bacterium]
MGDRERRPRAISLVGVTVVGAVAVLLCVTVGGLAGPSTSPGPVLPEQAAPIGTDVGPVDTSSPELATNIIPGADIATVWAAPALDGGPRGELPVVWDNGGPLDDWGDPASQWSDPNVPDWRFVAGAADDFVLTGGSPSASYRILKIRAAFLIYRGTGSETPADWTGIDVTVYADSPGSPSGYPTITGGHTAYVIDQVVSSGWTHTLVGTCRPCFVVDIPVDFVLAKNTTYWLSIVPHVTALPQVMWCLSSYENVGLYRAKQGASFGPPFWNLVQGNTDKCPPDTPPWHSRRDLAFLLYGGDDVTGSCCHDDGTCTVTIQPACNGQWTLSGVCDPNPCPPAGSCCDLVTGACTIKIEAACTGAWTLGGVCTPNPCPPTGSCCDPVTGACTVRTELGCVGNWRLGGVCTPNPCPPTGSCCDPVTGVCTVRTELGCVGNWTSGGVCTPNPCPPTGSCCDPVTGVCTVTTELGCVGGNWALGGVCTPNPCPPTGSCCDLMTGECTITTELGCSGDWTLGGVCTPSPCPPTGSCCNLMTGECSITTALGCSGDWTLGGVCEPNPCPPVGACCNLLTGECTVTTAAGCSGDWTLGGVCSPNPCPPTGSCCNLMTGECSITTELGCSGDWTLGGVCTPNPCPPTGSCCDLLTNDCTITTEVGCTGHWTLGASCEPNPCADRACCRVDGSCTDLPESACILPGDTFYADKYCGDPTLTCPLPPTHDCCIGDNNEDGHINGQDIQPFVARLLNPPARGSNAFCEADINLDLQINLDDVGPFVQMLLEGASCPPPPPDCCHGDTNGDGLLDGRDVEGLCRALIELPPAGSLGFCRADVNKDGAINQGDVQALVQKLLAGEGCAAATGACCQADGTCAVTLQMDCVGGQWTLGGTCDPNPCQQPTGSCCHADGSCAVTLHADCTDTWTMFGTCDPNPCPQPSGSCCHADGTCTVTLQTACVGAWVMGGVCAPNPCPCPLPGDLNADGVVNGLDIQGFVDCVLGSGSDCRCGDFNGDKVVDLNDLSGFFAVLGVPASP